MSLSSDTCTRRGENRLHRPLVVFDMDGTLYRSETSFLRAIERTIERYRLSARSRTEILSFLTGTSHEFSARMLEGHAEIDPAEFVGTFRGYEREEIVRSGACYEGVEPMLRELRDDGFPLAVCSNGSESYLNAILEKTGLRPYFVRISGNDRNVPKSVLVEELLAGRAADETEPALSSRGVVIGDSLVDQSSAESNRIPFVEAAYGYGNFTVTERWMTADAPSKIPSAVRCADACFRIEEAIRRRRLEAAPDAGTVGRGESAGDFEAGDGSMAGGRPGAGGGFDAVSESTAMVDRALVGPPFVVGIDGVDCSGKTVFAGLLAEFLRLRGFPVEVVQPSEDGFRFTFSRPDA